MKISSKGRFFVLVALCLIGIGIGASLFLAQSAPQDRGVVSMIVLLLLINLGICAIFISFLAMFSRLQRLVEDVKAMAAGNDVSRRVAVQGDDEISDLANNINAMLTSLEQTQEYLVVARDSAEASDRSKSALIEQLRRRDLELVRARNAAEQANNAKSDFLANTSHEIRTPINNIVGFAEILAETVDDDKQKRCVELIRTSADSLLGVINDILDLSKIEAQKLEFTPSACDLGAYLQNILAPFRAQAQRQKVEMSILIDNLLPKQVLVDASRLGQVVMNLVNNALKFTPSQGSIWVKLNVLEEIESEKVQVQFSVQDNGIGISPASQAKIFEPFQQADSSITREYGGTGLGLSISQRIVSALGGKLEVSSALGAGSTFSFQLSLPVITAAAAAEDAVKDGTWSAVSVIEARQKETRAPSEFHILVVEDNALSREISLHRLKKLGFLVDAAENGEQAVALAKGHSFDLILMDCQMPNMDGFQATALIRQHEKDNKSYCPIVALTAHAMEGYRDICLKAGMDDYLVKPIKESELSRFLKSFEEEKRQTMLNNKMQDPLNESGESL